MSAEVAEVAGAVGALGLTALMLGTIRSVRIGGLAAWAVGSAGLAIYLAPAGHHRAYAAAAVVGMLAAGALAWLFVRVPWVLPVAILACAPARIPVSVGSTKANLLLPLYLVVVAAALALAWELFGDDARRRELGPLAWPLGLLAGWTGVSFLWTADTRQGAIFLLFFVLPFGLLTVAVARLPWRIGWVKGLYVQLTAMAVVFALIGAYQYVTRDIYWNPKVKVDNAYAPSSWFYRVNSVFYDPSIYGRFLVVAILAGLVVVCFARGGAVWGAMATTVLIWIGLVPSFSQSSFVALAVGAVAGLAVLWWNRAVLALAVIVGVVAAAAFVGFVVREHGFSRSTGGRAGLLENGVRLAADHPLAGVGAGGFRRAYADRVGLKGKEPKAAASHNTPITVAAETGLPGLLLLAWLLVAALVLAVRHADRATANGRVRLAFGLALLAIVVHSLFYNALFEDPLFWGLLGLTALAAREPEAA